MEVLLVEGPVYTGFMPARRVEALVVLGGRVVYAGGVEEARARAARIASGLGVGVEEHRLEGVGLPGFVDAHLHLGSTGFASLGVDLYGVGSVEELVERVAREASRFKGWVYGRGWDQEKMGAWPTRWDLDGAVPDKPVVLVRVCGHAAVLNTEGLRRLGVLEDPGRWGRLADKTCKGEPTGVVFEELAWRAVRMAEEDAEPAHVVAAGAEKLISYGVTMAGDMAVGERWLSGLLAAWGAGRLPLRVRIYLDRGLYERLAGLGLARPFGDEMLRIVGVKVFADGSLGARTARLREPYADDPSTQGTLLMDYREVARLAAETRGSGLDLAVHAIGDEALDHVLRGFLEARCRCRIEHASVVRDDQLALIAKIRPRVAVQPRFIKSDTWLEERLGRERLRLAYRFKSLADHGAVVGFSSDSPVETPNPLEAVYYAVERPGLAEASPGEKMSVEEALYYHTRGAARVLGEPRAGCLEPGCYADIAVVEEDPLSVEPWRLLDLRVVETVVGGRSVYP